MPGLKATESVKSPLEALVELARVRGLDRAAAGEGSMSRAPQRFKYADGQDDDALSVKFSELYEALENGELIKAKARYDALLKLLHPEEVPTEDVGAGVGDTGSEPKGKEVDDSGGVEHSALEAAEADLERALFVCFEKFPMRVLHSLKDLQTRINVISEQGTGSKGVGKRKRQRINRELSEVLATLRDYIETRCAVSEGGRRGNFYKRDNENPTIHFIRSLKAFINSIPMHERFSFSRYYVGLYEEAYELLIEFYKHMKQVDDHIEQGECVEGRREINQAMVQRWHKLLTMIDSDVSLKYNDDAQSALYGLIRLFNPTSDGYMRYGLAQKTRYDLMESSEAAIAPLSALSEKTRMKLLQASTARTYQALVNGAVDMLCKHASTEQLSDVRAWARDAGSDIETYLRHMAIEDGLRPLLDLARDKQLPIFKQHAPSDFLGSLQDALWAEYRYKLRLNELKTQSGELDARHKLSLLETQIQLLTALVPSKSRVIPVDRNNDAFVFSEIEKLATHFNTLLESLEPAETTADEEYRSKLRYQLEALLRYKSNIENKQDPYHAASTWERTTYEDALIEEITASDYVAKRCGLDRSWHFTSYIDLVNDFDWTVEQSPHLATMEARRESFVPVGKTYTAAMKEANKLSEAAESDMGKPNKGKQSTMDTVRDTVAGYLEVKGNTHRAEFQFPQLSRALTEGSADTDDSEVLDGKSTWVDAVNTLYLALYPYRVKPIFNKADKSYRRQHRNFQLICELRRQIRQWFDLSSKTHYQQSFRTAAHFDDRFDDAKSYMHIAFKQAEHIALSRAVEHDLAEFEKRAPKPKQRGWLLKAIRPFKYLIPYYWFKSKKTFEHADVIRAKNAVDAIAEELTTYDETHSNAAMWQVANLKLPQALIRHYTTEDHEPGVTPRILIKPMTSELTQYLLRMHTDISEHLVPYADETNSSDLAKLELQSLRLSIAKLHDEWVDYIVALPTKRWYQFWKSGDAIKQQKHSAETVRKLFFDASLKLQSLAEKENLSSDHVTRVLYELVNDLKTEFDNLNGADVKSPVYERLLEQLNYFICDVMIGTSHEITSSDRTSALAMLISLDIPEKAALFEMLGGEDNESMIFKQHPDFKRMRKAKVELKNELVTELSFADENRAKSDKEISSEIKQFSASYINNQTTSDIMQRLERQRQAQREEEQRINDDAKLNLFRSTFSREISKVVMLAGVVASEQVQLKRSYTSAAIGLVDVLAVGAPLPCVEYLTGACKLAWDYWEDSSKRFEADKIYRRFPGHADSFIKIAAKQLTRCFEQRILMMDYESIETVATVLAARMIEKLDDNSIDELWLSYSTAKQADFLCKFAHYAYWSVGGDSEVKLNDKTYSVNEVLYGGYMYVVDEPDNVYVTNFEPSRGKTSTELCTELGYVRLASTLDSVGVNRHSEQSAIGFSRLCDGAVTPCHHAFITRKPTKVVENPSKEDLAEDISRLRAENISLRTALEDALNRIERLEETSGRPTRSKTRKATQGRDSSRSPARVMKTMGLHAKSNKRSRSLERISSERSLGAESADMNLEVGS